MKLSEIAKRIEGKLIGSDIEIKGVSSIDEADEAKFSFIATFA